MALCTTPAPTLTTGPTSSQATARQPLAELGELTLRVRGPGRDGQLVKIRSPKCTIGSAQGCTLRLRSAGIGPLQCWVLRGPGGTIVRRLHGPATLNGGAFDEAVLGSGDRLQLGSVELEVVECNRAVLAPAPRFTPPDTAEGELAQLRAELSASQERAKRLEAEARQGFGSSIMAAERADQLRDALAAAHEQLAEVCRDLTAAQDALSTQTAELESCRRQLAELGANQATLTTHSEEARRLAAAKSDELAALAAELSQTRTARDQLRDQLETERTQLERRLAQRDAELAALRSSTAAQTGAMTVAISELSENQQTLKEELTAKCAALEAELASRQSEIEALRRAASDQTAQHNQQLLQTRQEIEAERDELLLQRHELADEQTRLATLQFQLEQKQESLIAVEAQRNTLAAAEAHLFQQTTELEAQVAAATARLTEVEQLREQLLEQRAALAERGEHLDSRQRELEQRAAELVQQACELEALGRELSDRQASVARLGPVPHAAAAAAGDEPIGPPLSECQQPQPARDRPERGLEMPANVTEMSAPEELEEVTGNAQPVDAAAPALVTEPIAENVSESREVDLVLSRLVKAGVWRNAEQPVSEGPAASDPSDDLPRPTGTIDPGDLPATGEGRAAPGPRSASPPGLSDDEESIESYMDRLMQRVRGDSPSSQSGWKPAAQPATPAPAVPQPQAATASPPQTAEELTGEYSPLRHAPELGTNMLAMRALANSAARSAIDLHVRQHTSKQAVGRLIGACLTVTASLVLGYWALRAHSLQAGVGAGIGGAAGGYWTWAAIRRFAILRRLNQAQASQAAQIASPAPAPALIVSGSGDGAQ